MIFLEYIPFQGEGDLLFSSAGKIEYGYFIGV
jgi:hypothetical protein